jgi:hypothetical protein
MKLIIKYKDSQVVCDTGDDLPTVDLVLQLFVAEHPKGTFSPSHLSLVHKGKRLSLEKDTGRVLEGVVEGAKLLLFGSTIAEVEEASNPPPAPRVRNDLPGAPPERAPFTAPPPRRGPQRLPGSDGHDGSPKYGFGQIQVCEEYSNREEAREILFQLASHPGVLEVMRKRQWFVPTLAEMRPGTKMDRSDHSVHVLGLNENGGQRILLLLRTDDGMGFRRKGSGYALDGNGLLDVLYHELTHIQEHGDNPHSQAFYALEREVKREADAKQHFSGGGRSTAGRGGEVFQGWGGGGGGGLTAAAAAAAAPTGYTLGGDAGAVRGKTTRELAAEAALARQQRQQDDPGK